MPHTPSSFALGQRLEAEKMVEKVRQRASAWQDKVAQTGRRCSRAGSQAARQPGSQAGCGRSRCCLLCAPAVSADYLL
eukprot:COSAG02_NODE_7169_length_3139_cov_1.525329_3_plen_78_part_00